MQYELIKALTKFDEALSIMADRMSDAKEYHFARVMIYCEEMSELIHTLTKRVRNVPTSDVEEELADVALTIYALEPNEHVLRWMLGCTTDSRPRITQALLTMANSLERAVRYLDNDLVSHPQIQASFTPVIDLIPRISSYALHEWAIAKIKRLDYRVRIKDE